LGSVEVSGQPNVEKTSFERPVLFIFTKLTTQNLCSLSIVKRGATVIIHFGLFPNSHFFSIQKIQKNKKYYEKNITVKRGSQSALKMVKNWLRRFKDSKIKI